MYTASIVAYSFRLLLLAQKTPLRVPNKVHPQHWLNFSIGRSNFWISAVLNSRDKSIGIEFSFNGPLKQMWFNNLLSKRDEIETAVGRVLVWDALENRKSSRIALYKDEADPKDEKQWPFQHAWLAEMLEKLHGVFKIYVQSLPGQKESQQQDEISDLQEG